MASDEFLDDVAEYYSSALRKHGPSPRGVDWNSEDGQRVRFAQLSKLITEPDRWSLNDLGCGYGALAEYLCERFPAVDYAGFDISSAMIAAARERYAGTRNIRFEVAPACDRVADYAVASGLFNVKLATPASAWREYLEATLENLHGSSRKGFAFNCLTSYSDVERLRDDLYYEDPCRLFDLCKRRYSRDVALLHDYGLYEFTILVRKHP